MRVLITGAGGNLGRTTIPALREAGHEPVAFDFRPIDTDAEFIEGDVRDVSALTRALTGCDAVVHAAALHGVHLSHWSAQDFFSINVRGSFNVLETASAAGIERFVLASTMGVYGESLEAPPGTWAWVHEGLPALPKDVYGVSKLLAEELGRYYARIGSMRVVALRFGMYVPATFEHYGFRLLFGGVDERDVAHAVQLSLEHEPERRFDTFDIMADTPFVPEDARAMNDDPAAVIERYWPGSNELFEQKHIDVRANMSAKFLWPVDKARSVLGYRPAWTFDAFLDALRTGETDRYPFLGLGQWGIRVKD